MSAEGEDTILVVDDNPDLLFLVAESLREFSHYQVVTALDGVEGLHRYYETQPACVIIDVKMPGLDGYQLVRALRGDPETKATPLIILSALIQRHEQLAGLLAGADRYLTKPVTPTDLVSVIENAIAETADQRDARQRQIVDSIEDE